MVHTSATSKGDRFSGKADITTVDLQSSISAHKSEPYRTERERLNDAKGQARLLAENPSNLDITEGVSSRRGITRISIGEFTIDYTPGKKAFFGLITRAPQIQQAKFGETPLNKKEAEEILKIVIDKQRTKRESLVSLFESVNHNLEKILSLTNAKLSIGAGGVDINIKVHDSASESPIELTLYVRGEYSAGGPKGSYNIRLSSERSGLLDKHGNPFLLSGSGKMSSRVIQDKFREDTVILYTKNEIAVSKDFSSLWTE